MESEEVHIGKRKKSRYIKINNSHKITLLRNEDG